MRSFEKKITPPTFVSENTEKKKSEAEQKSSEVNEEFFDAKKFTEFTAERLQKIQKIGGETISESKRLWENALNTGNKLGFKKEEINHAAEEMKIGINLQLIQETVRKLVNEAQNQIGEITREQPSLSENDQEIIESQNTLQQKEQEYLSKKLEKAPGLDIRYEDERSNANYLQKQISEYVSGQGFVKEIFPELIKQNFNLETKKIILDKTRQNLDKLFLNKESGRFNPEKHQLMTKQTERYLDLLEKAQKEGDLKGETKAVDVLNLVEKNISLMAYQDRVDSENMIGDHGIRHIAGFNIQMVEQILNSIGDKGQEVKGIDKIMGHQIMLMHDLGYATEPIREEVNKGNMPADKGHNLLSAKILRQMTENPNDPLTKIFSHDQLSVIHQGILEHDDSTVDFHVNDGHPEARTENLLSAVHLADNIHAFEDKLPELLYVVPESLKTMRMLKTAGEIGDKNLFTKIKNDLVGTIKNTEHFSPDDKEALTKAAVSLGESSYKFTVGRICGNKPEISIDHNGKACIKVQESALHQEVVGLFGQESYDQLKKFIADLEGKEKHQITNEMLN